MSRMHLLRILAPHHTIHESMLSINALKIVWIVMKSTLKDMQFFFVNVSSRDKALIEA